MKILVVEDSKFMRVITSKKLLENFPHATIIGAADGLEGLSLYQSEKPDLIITDLLMPNMNGHEFIQRVRMVDATIPCLVLSADIQQSTREEMAQLGVLTFINKPLSPEKTTHMISLIKELGHA